MNGFLRIRFFKLVKIKNLVDVVVVVGEG